MAKDISAWPFSIGSCDSGSLQSSPALRRGPREGQRSHGQFSLGMRTRVAHSDCAQSVPNSGALGIIPAHLGALSTDEGAIAWLGVARTYESPWTGLKILRPFQTTPALSRALQHIRVHGFLITYRMLAPTDTDPTVN